MYFIDKEDLEFYVDIGLATTHWEVLSILFIVKNIILLSEFI